MVIIYLVVGYLVSLCFFASMHHPAPIVLFLGLGAAAVTYAVVLDFLWRTRAPHAFLADLLATVPALMFGAAGCLLTPFVGIPCYLIVWWLVFRIVMGKAPLPSR